MPWLRPSHDSPAPYDADLAAFAARVDRLPHGDVLFLRAVWNDLDAGELERARSDARAAVDRAGRSQVVAELDQSLVRWVGGSTPGLGTVDWIQEPSIAIERDTRRQGLAVLRDVGLALIARDLVSPSTYELLSEPWRALQAEPPSDEPTG